MEEDGGVLLKMSNHKQLFYDQRVDMEFEEIYNRNNTFTAHFFVERFMSLNDKFGSFEKHVVF